jgi:hypothetical protein
VKSVAITVERTIRLQRARRRAVKKKRPGELEVDLLEVLVEVAGTRNYITLATLSGATPTRKLPVAYHGSIVLT